jgi:oligopeptide/dipeptide ABC transporter ATP-binding protein
MLAREADQVIMTEQHSAKIPLLRVDDLIKHFPVGHDGPLSRSKETVKAVDGVSFEVPHGATFSVVGESGCGKSTLGRALLRLIEPTSGRIRLEGEDIVGLSSAALRRKRRDMQIIFQDPFSSLHPRMTAGALVAEPIILHKLYPAQQIKARTAELFDLVGLAPYQMSRYPHEFSGGQRQRIAIARALAVEPKIVVCDEPVSALDVSIQAQIVNLLKELQARLGVGYVFISHDLAVVRYISDSVAVMYLGKLVEIGPKTNVFAAPRHPYTKALLSAVPRPDPTRRSSRIVLHGDVPSPISPPAGCRFHTRCPHAQDICRRAEPALETDKDGHRVACHLWQQLS